MPREKENSYTRDDNGERDRRRQQQKKHWQQET